MPKRILIIGPSGSGKTYVSAALRAKEINAPDGDLIEGLSDWFDGNGNKVECPPDAGKKFLDSHQFLWDKDVLRQFLDNQNEVYLFGMSGNIFDMLDLFNKAYFLRTSPEILAQRLRHNSRKNPMGKTDYQLQNAIKWGEEMGKKARDLGVEAIDANQPPDAIFAEINKN